MITNIQCPLFVCLDDGKGLPACTCELGIDTCSIYGDDLGPYEDQICSFGNCCSSASGYFEMLSCFETFEEEDAWGSPSNQFNGPYDEEQTSNEQSGDSRSNQFNGLYDDGQTTYEQFAWTVVGLALSFKLLLF